MCALRISFSDKNFFFELVPERDSSWIGSNISLIIGAQYLYTVAGETFPAFAALFILPVSRYTSWIKFIVFCDVSRGLIDKEKAIQYAHKKDEMASRIMKL